MSLKLQLNRKVQRLPTVYVYIGKDKTFDIVRESGTHDWTAYVWSKVHVKDLSIVKDSTVAAQAQAIDADTLRVHILAADTSAQSSGEYVYYAEVYNGSKTFSMGEGRFVLVRAAS